MKKIAVICDYKLFPERIGGMDHFFWLFDLECKKKGNEVIWFFPNDADFSGYQNLNIVSDNEGLLTGVFLNYCKENNPGFTIVFTHFVELCTSFFLKIKKINNPKIIAVDHNPRPLSGYPLKKKITKRIKGILYSKHIDLFIGVSHYTVNEILADFGSHLKNKTITIYNGVVTKDILVRNYRNDKKPSFLVASHLRESKGIQDLIEAVNLLLNEIKNEIKIDIYGEGLYENFLKTKVEQYQLDSVFNFMGSKPNLKEIFCLYDYMLQPTHMECFSLSILESLAANVPVVTTNVGGNEEAITNNKNGYIFEAKNKNELKTLLENLYLGNQKIILNTRLLIEESFSLEKMVENYIMLI
ncbi:MAG: glycosyltransferase family 4 protein [Bacteroidota bacterium]